MLCNIHSLWEEHQRVSTNTFYPWCRNSFRFLQTTSTLFGSLFGLLLQLRGVIIIILSYSVDSEQKLTFKDVVWVSVYSLFINSNLTSYKLCWIPFKRFLTLWSSMFPVRSEIRFYHISSRKYSTRPTDRRSFNIALRICTIFSSVEAVSEWHPRAHSKMKVRALLNSAAHIFTHESNGEVSFNA